MNWLGSLRATIPYLLSRTERTKEVTEQYPDPISARSPEDLPPRSRGLLRLDLSKCTGCGDCVEVCPTDCIRLQTEPGDSPEKKWVSTFDIDFSSCVFCGLCVEVCAPVALTHSREYELASSSVLNLSKNFGGGPITDEQREKWAMDRQSREEAEFWK